MTTRDKLKEFDVSKLLRSIPKHFKIGLKTSPLLLTCIDSYKDHIVFGTNAGLIYLIYLPSLNLIKLYLKATQYPVRCVSSFTSVCDVLACGTSNGTISIFMLERKSSLLSNSYTNGGVTNSKLTSGISFPKLFTISDLHSSCVTSLTWSDNGASLFIGDEAGRVGVITIQYDAGACTGTLIHRMDSNIVQLSFSQNLLAISCLNQCAIYNLEEQSVTPVGKNVIRKYPGKFGCTFLPSGTKFEPLFCARSMQRLWAVNNEGVVQWTFINMDPTRDPPSVNKNPTFGTLHIMDEFTLVSHIENSVCLFDLNINKIIHEASFNSNITGISITDSLIVILLSDLQLVCMSKEKPVYYDQLMKSTDPVSVISDISNLTFNILPDATKITNNLSKLGEELSQSVFRRSKDIFKRKASVNTTEVEYASGMLAGDQGEPTVNQSRICVSNAESIERVGCDNSINEEILVVPKSSHSKIRRKKAKETLQNTGFDGDSTCEVLKSDKTTEELESVLQTDDDEQMMFNTCNESESNVEQHTSEEAELLDNIRPAESTLKDVPGNPLVPAEDAAVKEASHVEPSTFSLKIGSRHIPGDWTKLNLFTKVEKAIGYASSVAFHDGTSVYLPMGEHQYRKVAFDRQINGLFYDHKKQLAMVNLSGDLFKVSDSGVASELVADGVKTACLDLPYIWLVKLNNQVCVLPGSPVLPPIQIHTEFQLSKIVSLDGVVWGLSHDGAVYYRIGTSLSGTGIEWVQMQGNCQSVADIHLSADGIGWKVDILGRIFLLPFISQHYPQGIDANWWQVNFCEYLLVSGGQRLSLTSDDENLWLIEEGEPTAYTHSIRSFTACRWEVYAEEIFASVYAEACYGKHGALYCLDESGKLFVVNRKTRSVIPISSPTYEKILSVACRCEILWVLTESGLIYSRSGLSINHFIGNQWERIDQTDIKKVHLVHISLGCEIVWAVDWNGKAYIRMGTANVSNSGNYYPWLQVDDLPNVQLKKISVGSLCHMVWAIDFNGRLYAREGVYENFPIGGTWTLLEGIQASDVSICENKVFVRTVNGQVFHRKGVNSIGGNYIGDSWLKMPNGLTKVARMSATTDGILYGLNDDGRIIKQHTLNLAYAQGLSDAPLQGDELDSDDYEVI